MYKDELGEQSNHHYKTRRDNANMQWIDFDLLILNSAQLP
jgi:hypothetical protein